MTTRPPHNPLSPQAHARAQVEGFDEHWLRHLHWTLLDEDGGLVRWRVRSPIATRDWLILRPRSDASDADFRRMEREWNLAGELHAAWALVPVAQLHTPEGPITVFDDHGGQPLTALADGKISVERFLRLATSAAAALAGAHRHGLVHCDIKPANLMLGRDDQVRLSGFALARRLGEHPASAGGIYGSLPYMSPEQGGRLAQVADQRSDLYSLGVSFYELLTGHLPFDAHDPVAWLHQHVAVPAPALSLWRDDLPPALQPLLEDLLAKTPDARTANADALELRLREALSEWNEFGHLSAQRLAATPARTQHELPLPSRTALLNQLIDASQRLQRRQPGGVILLGAAAGMGKTTLARQLRRHLGSSPVLFAGARFEAGQQHRPYAAIAGMLGALLARLAGLGAKALADWRERLLAATAPHGQLLARLVPELEQVTGPLPPSNEPAEGDARGRLRHLLLRTWRALTGPQHPLIVLLDDLHWLDDASLALLCELRREDFDHLLLLGACRDDQAHRNPLLEQWIAHCHSLQIPLTLLPLPDLTLADTRALVHACPGVAEAQVDQLAECLHPRTAGNPLFISQLLQAMQELPHAGEGQADAALSDIFALMGTRLARLPERTAQLLYRMALFGQHAPRAELALAGQLSVNQLPPVLAPAIHAGLIREDHSGLSFCHDSVRDAARALQPAERHGAEHAAIAWRLVGSLGPAPSSDSLFRLAAQVLQATVSGLPALWRRRFIEVLAQAALRAKEAAAAPFALQYLAQAQHLLSLDGRQRDRDSQYQLGYLQAQCLILNGDYGQADAQIVELLELARSAVAVTPLYLLKSEVMALAGDYPAAVQAAVDGLAVVGLRIASDPDDAQVQAAAQALDEHLAGRSIASLIDLPELDNATVARQIELLARAVIPGSFIRANLMFVLLCHAVRLTLQHGISPAGAQACAWFGVASAHRNDAHARGLQWAHLALQLVERHAYHPHKAPALLVLGQLSVWQQPLSQALGYAEQALRESLASDMPSMACYANNHIVSDLLVMGAPIERILRQIDTGLGMARNLEFADSQNILFIQALYIRRLAGTPQGAVSIPSRAELGRRLAHTRHGRALFWWSLFEGLFFYLEGNFAEAGAHLDRAWAQSWVTPAHIHLIDLALFSVLNAAASLGQAAGADVQARATLQRGMQRLRYFADLNPRAFADRHDLALAEVLRADGQLLEALQQYDRAIARAIACGAVHIQGLAYELASRCHLQLGLQVSARAHQRQARDAWRRWGALALAEQMEAAHPHLQTAPSATRASVELPGGQQQLDLLSITKACQALSREIELDRLIETLLSNTLVHAGASHAVLLLLDEGGLRVRASGQAGHGGVEYSAHNHVAEPEELPLSLIRSAVRGRQPLVLDDAGSHPRFADDPYLRRHPCGSRLCVPLLQQNESIGALYLENPLTYGVFSPARVDVLELLAAQAAISISTARLYRDLLEENRRRRDSEATLRTSRALLALGETGGRHGSFIWKPALDRSFWSPELFAQLGLVPAPSAPGQARRLELAAHVHPDDRARFDRTLQQASAAHEPFRLDFRVVSQGGEICHLQALGEPDGEQLYLGVVFDVSERRRTEAALRSARAELGRTSQATVLGELAASIAHEVNQPLTAILSNAGAALRWLRRDTAVLDEAVASLESIVLDGQRTAAIVGALRALARQAPPERQALDLGGLIRHVLSLTANELQDRYTTVALDLADLPPVQADAVQLQQVILNLVNNAADAVQGLPPLARRLRVQTRAIPGGVLVLVEDNGCGLDASLGGDIFKAFFTTKANGTGMGLAICSSIVTAHGGVLLALSGRQGETVFAFTLAGGQGWPG
ncbi:AAA family ATPase [Pseudomonas sp. HR96]|uniref:AAA family ATPase n=1 Tax=Pseudomonas sp. HR96 TaxID=1027966 RepID=UPI002A75ABE4|nr:AAA family ATPase [Pseudomonas sp. HR96]WPP01708.1 AAA family ATPase [Pseudomonas sp. HR96]